jgi:hypothetical protein
LRFRLYTEKTVSQSLTALNERMHQKATSTRPGLDGWIEKNGAFSLSVNQPVVGKFTRTTRLTGRLTRQGSMTVIEATVSGGVEPRNRIAVYIGLGIIGAVFVLAGSPLLGLVLIPIGALLYIPMKGDYVNSTLLINEIQKALKARATPPKTAAKAGVGKSPARALSAAPAASAGMFGSPRAFDEEDEDEEEDT